MSILYYKIINLNKTINKLNNTYINILPILKARESAPSCKNENLNCPSGELGSSGSEATTLNTGEPMDEF